jgi:hypothetical protein
VRLQSSHTGGGAAGREALTAVVSHPRGVNVGLPRVWMIYLAVGDLAESLRHVQEEGGKVIKATQGEDGEYAYAAVQNRVGGIPGVDRGVRWGSMCAIGLAGSSTSCDVNERLCPNKTR